MSLRRFQYFISYYLKNVIKILFLNILITNIVFSQTLEQSINSENRTIDYKKRDKYRNPLDTLSFFNVTNDMTVIELQPSGGISPAGWYTEILAPYLKNNGLLIAAHFNPKESDWRAKMRDNFELLIKKKPDYNKIKMSMLSIPPSKLAEDSTADMILTFRNLHNWLKSNALKEVF